MNFQRIMVGLDDSTLSQVVLAAALELAKQGQATMMLVNCVVADLVGQPMLLPTDIGTSSEMSATYQIQQLEVHERTALAQDLLERYRQQVEQQGLLVETECCIGDPGRAVCDLAEKWNADLIVVGRRGRKGLEEVLLGSISNHVVHHAHCSVLVVQGGKVEPA
jgi:nucleotide-binding universal stress UspA family protein